MSFSGSDNEVVYILVSINIHVGKDMDIFTTTVMYWFATKKHGGYVTMKKSWISEGIRIMSTINYHMKMNKSNEKKYYERSNRIV